MINPTPGTRTAQTGLLSSTAAAADTPADAAQPAVAKLPATGQLNETFDPAGNGPKSTFSLPGTTSVDEGVKQTTNTRSSPSGPSSSGRGGRSA